MSEPNILMTALSVLSYQYSNLPMYITAESCAGKTYIITGANSGLGYECAKHLVKLGAQRVILAVRSRPRGNEAVEAIEAETGVRDVAQVWDLDLASYESAIAFSRRVENELERVDAVVESAVTMTKDWTVSEGMETSVTVNVVATLLLAILLMPHLETCATRFRINPSIVIITSGLAFTRQADLSKIDEDNILRDVSDAKKWSMDGTDR
jgi:NAD(P)-dependent dehydrogenase (short-subunit alcohol dehydrogenase family)